MMDDLEINKEILTKGQHDFIDSIVNHIRKDEACQKFLYGGRGSGKTFGIKKVCEIITKMDNK